MFNFLSKSHKPDPYRQRMAYCPPPMPSEMTRDVHKTLARLFATEDGRKVLAWLQLTTFQKALGPDAPDCAFITWKARGHWLQISCGLSNGAGRSVKL